MDREQLTDRQRSVYEFVREKICNRGYGPTVREICDEFGIKSPNGVVCHLKALEKKGLIRRTANKSRAIELVGGRPVPGTTLPSKGLIGFDGIHPSVRADDAHVDFNNLLNHDGGYLLQVVGNSMTDVNLLDGDFVVVAPDAAVSEGEIVVARSEDGSIKLRVLDDQESYSSFDQPPHHRSVDNTEADSTESALASDAGTVSSKTMPSEEIVGRVLGVIRDFSRQS